MGVEFGTLFCFRCLVHGEFRCFDSCGEPIDVPKLSNAEMKDVERLDLSPQSRCRSTRSLVRSRLESNGMFVENAEGDLEPMWAYLVHESSC
jgi:hypothetical protein